MPEVIDIQSWGNIVNFGRELGVLVDTGPFQFEIDTIAIAGASLWALALYLGLPGIKQWMIEQLSRWFNVAERTLYTSAAEFERTRLARESQNAFYASLFSTLPFLLMGVACHYGVALTLGRSWAISFGLMICMAVGVYQLGRQMGTEDRRD